MWEFYSFYLKAFGLLFLKSQPERQPELVKSSQTITKILFCDICEIESSLEPTKLNKLNKLLREWTGMLQCK